MSVLAQNTARADVLLRRGVSETWGVRWEQDSGSGYAPVDISTWSGTVQLRSDTGEVWAEFPVQTFTDGLATVTIAADALTTPIWATRGAGNWRMNITNTSGHVERLADGYFYLED
ncbi:hypothetical protein [Mycetocola saprophilus]|uniref:hypothetical protein n=1 Tax=Mycetocola saprophilus TaxID=76636 RepID=UPI0006911962|nr:hypothetical protein [Mycetocola saprophilus]